MDRIQLLGKEKEKILSISLEDILKIVEDGNDFYWKVFWIEGVSDGKLNMLELEKKAKKGLSLTFNQLDILSKSIYQLYEILLVGSSKPIDDYNETNTDYNFIFELIDSSYWEISSKDSVFIRKLQNEFI